MNIRRAKSRDINDVLRLLSQVLEIHADIRPDIFISGTTKYGHKDLEELFADDLRPVYVATDENDNVRGYAFCKLLDPPFTNTMKNRRTMFIDDLCVDVDARGRHIGSDLFEYVKSQAKLLGCSDITLNVWEGNDAAYDFYKAKGMKARETQMEIML